MGIDKIVKTAMCHISPVVVSKYCYYNAFGERLNLKKPQKFNEKLMWLKHYKYINNPLVWKCVDKYTVREYAISKGVKEENLPELIKTYTCANDIDFDELPSKFALKCTHGCGFNIICDDKDKLDKSLTVKKLNKWLNTSFGYESAELQYIHEKPRIICEKFIENNNGEFPSDYKLYCFNGEPKVVLVCTNRKFGYKTHFYDMQWNKLHLRDSEANDNINKPQSLDEMADIARKVANGFEFVRVDFYELKNRAILGEMTFTPAACLGKYTEQGDKYLSDMLELNI